MLREAAKRLNMIFRHHVERKCLIVWPGLCNTFRYLRSYGKMGNKKHANCFATLLQNELNRDAARFTTHIKPVLQQIRLSPYTVIPRAW